MSADADDAAEADIQADDELADADGDVFDGDPSDPNSVEEAGEPLEETIGSGDAVGSEDEELQLDLDLGKVFAERDEYLDALRRLQADFDNFRKRTMRQQTETLDRAAESLILRLLPVLDALDLALAHLGEEGPSASGDALVQIASLLRGTLEKEGLERIADSPVAFDPTRHDAVAHVPREPEDEDVPGGVVEEVLRAGYGLKGRVLRPAMVKVRG